MNQQLIEQKAKAILQNSFDKNIKPLIPITFKEAEGENGYNWIYEAMQEYGEWMQGEGERQWISVKDQLPYKDGDSQIFCLVWDTYEGHAVVRPYNEYHKCWDGEDADDFYTDATDGNISHWMPLPPKPQSHV